MNNTSKCVSNTIATPTGN